MPTQEVERVGIYPVWPDAWETMEDTGGKLHKGQIVRTTNGKLLVGQGMGDEDPAPMEFLSKEALIDYLNQNITGVNAPNF